MNCDSNGEEDEEKEHSGKKHFDLIVVVSVNCIRDLPKCVFFSNIFFNFGGTRTLKS